MKRLRAPAMLLVLVAAGWSATHVYGPLDAQAEADEPRSQAASLVKPAHLESSVPGLNTDPIALSSKHLDAVDKSRRIVVNLDTGWGMPGVEEIEVEEFIDGFFQYLVGMDGSQVDSIWWCWGDMNYTPYASQILPRNDDYQKWLKQGKDPLPIVIDQSKKKGIEAFYSFRINDSGAGGAGTVNPWANWGLWPALQKNPHWGQTSPFWPKPFQHFNFAVAEVRDYKLAIIREVVENYDFDGIEIDWRCGYGSLPFYHKWEYRDHLTAFMRSVREMLQEVAERRGRPYLLAARVPENIEGCHYDGIHVERWVAESLVDMLALGCKSFEVDLDAFKRLTRGTHVKLYPSLDDHHRASGYDPPSLAVYRGAASSFLHQGADGIYAFNWYPVPIILDPRVHPTQEKLRRQALCEMGSLDTLKQKDKIFVTERRSGGGWPETAEHFYKNTSAFAQLPKELKPSRESVNPHGFVEPSREDYLFLQVGDDVNALAGEVARLELRIQFSGSAVASEAAVVDRLRARINGVVLPRPALHNDWLVYDLKPGQLAHGRNVVALVWRGAENDERVVVEKLEIHVDYQ